MRSKPLFQTVRTFISSWTITQLIKRRQVNLRRGLLANQLRISALTIR
jgi:hypothetical protein